MLVSTIAAWIGFMAVIFYQTLVVQPRAMRRRHALEARLDPAAAARRRRRERIHCWIGGTVGFVSGCAGVVLGLNAAGVFCVRGVGGVAPTCAISAELFGERLQPRAFQIGRASCRERGCQSVSIPVVAGS